METKENLIKYDNGKVRYDLVDPVFYRGLAQVMTYGAKKYQAYNWIKPIDDIGRLWASLQRHIEEMRFGNYIDDESKLRHAWHAGANIQFLDYHMRQGISGSSPCIAHDRLYGQWF